jgi:hypothetical protein
MDKTKIRVYKELSNFFDKKGGCKCSKHSIGVKNGFCGRMG